MNEGSSPRGRGKQAGEADALKLGGLIPAWAGKTTSGSGPCLRRPAHPRVGGENFGERLGRTLTGGSSPRGRGKRRLLMARSLALGLIPAWAGKTIRLGREKHRRWAHPRVGGENLDVGGIGAAAAGSSPRGRGKRAPGRGCRHRRGLIPAWAGKTSRSRAGTHTPWAHPRVGGENSARLFRAGRLRGSSPRGRGKRERCHRSETSVGLIPAWAGKTSAAAGSVSASRAHPRVGGENTLTPKPITSASGSSPRGRGKQLRGIRHVPAPGLIPAWAGKTTRTCNLGIISQAHPRVGGENAQSRSKYANDGGSSPRGRGKRWLSLC